jgi:hypothetical protein
MVAVDFEHFGDEAASRPALHMDDHMERVGDVGFNGAKAKVKPETTMATSDSPRAMVLVKACCRTLPAFSHGELACAKAGAATSRAKIRLR